MQLTGLIITMAEYGISVHATGWISLGNIYISGLDMEFLLMLIAGFPWEINPMAIRGISDYAIG